MMRLRPAVFPILLLLCGALTGCGRFFTKDNGGCTSNCSAATSAYVANASSNSISIYTVNSDGSLTVNGSVTTPAAPAALKVWNGKALYSANQNANSISGFAFGTNGALSEVTGSPFAAGATPADLAVNPLVNVLYVANAGDGTIISYSIDSASGALTVLGTTFSIGAAPLSLAVHPGGKFLFAALGTNGIAVIPINSDGTLASGHIVAPLAGGTPQMVVAPGSGNFVYAADGVAGVEIYNFDPTTGDLTAATSTSTSPNPVSSGTTPVALATDPGAHFLWVANKGSNTITAFAIAGDVLTQISGSPFAISGGAAAPSYVAIDPSGKFVYSVNQSGAPGVSVFTLDTAISGKLDLTSSANTGTQPLAIAFH